MAAARDGVRVRISLLSKAAVLVIGLLLAPCVCPPAAAQTTEQDKGAKAAAKRAKASEGNKTGKRRTPSSSTATGNTADAPAAETATKPAKKLDPAKADLLKLGALEAMQVDPSKLDPKSANTWVFVGLVEAFGGNLAGASESLERAMTLGERRNKAVAGAAAILLGKVHTTALSFVRVDASAGAMIGGGPASQGTMDSIRREFESAKAFFEKAIVFCRAADRKDGMAAGYAALGDLYSTTTDYDEAQAAIGKALVINKASQRKKEMAANYRALAETHRYDLDQAEALLKEAVALHEALDLKEELAKDYEKLGAISRTRGEPFEAERLYKRALALTPRLNHGSLLRALERLYEDRDDPGQAAEMRELAAAVSKEGRKEAGGVLVFSLSLGLWQSGVVAKRQTEALEKAVPLEKKLGHWVGLATSYTLLGMHYATRAEHDEEGRAELEGRAETMLREAIALNRTLKREPSMAYAYRQLAEIVDKRGNLAEVEETLREAQALHKKLGNDGAMARLYSLLGYRRSRRGDQAQACDYWRKGAMDYPDERDLVDMLNRNKCATTP